MNQLVKKVFNALVLFSFITPLFVSLFVPQIASAAFQETTVASGIQNVTTMTFAPDGRLFVAEQDGRVFVIKNGALLGTPFFTVNAEVSGERGLLGIAFDPNFTTNGHVYLFYTDKFTLMNKIVRVTRDPANPDVALPGETLIKELEIAQDGFHNAGAINFGLDGKLYVAMGDLHNSSNAQNLGNLAGKIMRLNSDGTTPTDNPFVSNPQARPEIYAYGLRNPFSFDINSVNGKIYVNDVGNGTAEEINDIVAGGNYGWPTCEGACSNPNFVNPIHQYQTGAQGCAVTGGTFTTGANLPAEFAGTYLFADFCDNYIKALKSDGSVISLISATRPFPVDIDIGGDGAVYYLARNGMVNPLGMVQKFEYIPDGNLAPIAVASANPDSGPAPLLVSFDGSASSDPDGTITDYDWDFGDGNTDSGAQVNHTYNSAGTYVATLTVSDGTDTGVDTVDVVVGNPPTVNFITPTVGSTYHAGDTINYSADATDSNGNTLPASAFSWVITFNHNTHAHPFLGPITGVKSGNFATLQTPHEASTNVWYRVTLTVTDSNGISTTVERDINPVISDLTFNTVPSGLSVMLEGQPMTTPFTVPSVVGMHRTVSVASPQTIGGTTYNFSSWSDGGAISHDITTPLTNTTYTANFQAQASSTLTNKNTASINIWNPSGIITVPYTTSGNNRVLLVVSRIQNGLLSGNVNVTATYGGVPMQLIAYNNVAFNADAQMIWGLVNPPLGTNNLIFDKISSGDMTVVAGVASYANVDQTTPWRNLVNVNGTGSTNATATATSVLNDEVFGAVSSLGFNVSSITLGAGQTVVSPYVNINGRHFMSSTEPGSASVIHNYTLNANADWRVMAISVKPAASDPTPPSTPANLRTTSVAYNQVNLAWDASTDNVGVANYKVYKNGAFLANSATLTYTDNAVNPATTYTYRVSAVDTSGNESPQSAPLDVNTPAFVDSIPPSIPGNLHTTKVAGNYVDLAWNASTDNIAVTGYRVYRDNSEIATTASGVLVFKDSTALPNTSYTYEVAAYDAAGNEGARASVPVTTGNPAIKTSIVVTPATLTINPGQNIQFSAQALDQYGDPVAASFVWANTPIVNISSSGLLTTTNQITVTATSDAVVGTAVITVN